MGATLANSIYSKSGNGVVFEGAARDLQEIKNMKGFNAFVRDFHPSFIEEMVLMGLNTPIRIGNVMVLPGDLGDCNNGRCSFCTGSHGRAGSKYRGICNPQRPIWF